MAATFKFEVVSPERVLLATDAEQVLVPGDDGDFTVFSGHAPVISTLRPGILEVKGPGGARRLYVKGGFAEVEPDRLTILAASAIDIADGARERIRSELAAAESELASASGDDAKRLAIEAVESLRRISA
ncbi:MAG TPA: ATP synthase F1 subunit epsilon [Hyphomicrobiaceae bacterium]|nr:ATP synthase F1 subunit epsilon [Hyphomicrobiaceae bacterium]